MKNNIKQIAVIMGAINVANQKLLLEGMEVAAKEANCNLFVFTNYIGTQETEESIIDATRILGLPDLQQFDAMIIAPNTLYNPKAIDKLFKEANEYGKPVVSINKKVEGASDVGVDNYAAQYEIVEHFLYHGYTNIIYVAGATIASSEARRRYLAFQDALQNNGIVFDETNVYEGAFTLESGVEIGKKILADGKHPEAIICGNDDMAYGIMDVFVKAGYQIPEDVKFAGFDNGEMASLNRPSLTTVDKNQREVGYKAVYEVMELLGGKDLASIELPCRHIYRESCGCSVKRHEVLMNMADDIKRKYVRQRYQTIYIADAVRKLTADFSRARTPVDLFEVYKGYIPQLEAKAFYLCVCDPEEIFTLPEQNIGRDVDFQKVNKTFTEKMHVAVAYEKGKFKKYEDFDKGLVLPEKCRNKKGGRTYVVNQLYYQDFCYGYTVCQSKYEEVASSLYYSMLMEVSVAMENVRQRMLLKDALDRLNGMWCYDNLTMLYNRSGFSYEAKAFMDRFRSDNKNVFVIFIDADGLKQVNDNIGHEAGDMLIRELGSIVHRNVSRDMLGMRYGGDEFVIFGGYKPTDAKKIDYVLETIREDMEEVNKTGKYPFKISASLGVSSWKAREIESLDKVIEQADQEMYEEKRAKKQAKAKENK